MLGIFITISLFFFILVSPAHAIVILPAVLLIPIAKLVAILIAGFSLPVLGIGTFWSKLTGTSLKKNLVLGLFLLFAMAVLLSLFLKMQSPERPWF